MDGVGVVWLLPFLPAVFLVGYGVVVLALLSLACVTQSVFNESSFFLQVSLVERDCLHDVLGVDRPPGIEFAILSILKLREEHFKFGWGEMIATLDEFLCQTYHLVFADCIEGTKVFEQADEFCL